MQICVDDARSVHPKIKLGSFGEHGSDLDGVPVARLAAAQAALESK